MTPDYPIESLWTVLEGTYAGRPMYVRRNESARTLQGAEHFPYRLGIAVQLHSPSPEGLPGPEEVEELNVLEDALREALEAGRTSLQVLAITTGGMREFVFYAHAPSLLEHLSEVQSKVPSHRITSSLSEDPTWTVYGEFL
jgi:hypothetical protein